MRAEVDGTNDFINTYGYDNLGRMTHVHQVEPATGHSVAEKRVDFAYNAGGQYASITRYMDITQTDLVAATTFAYDEAHRLTGLSHDRGTTNLADYAWTFDTSGRLTSVTTIDGTDDYAYDDTGQLIDVDSDYQSDEAYTYDANGNRTNTGYTTGDNNRLTSDGTFNYTYDDEGNRTKKTTISTGDYVEYTWDHRNRLTAVTFRNSSDVKTKEVTYVYDALDRRIAKDVDDDGDGTIDWGERYVYDGTDIALVFDESDNLVERLLYGPGVDQPLASEDGNGDVLWFLADNQGTIRDVAEYDAVSGDTTVVNHIQYGAFGQITSQSNATHEPRHTYTGREWDADSDMFYYRARWYDPVVGRFISEDPSGFSAGDANLSRYVGNSPTNAIDPSGLEEWVWPWDLNASWDPADTYDLWVGDDPIVQVPPAPAPMPAPPPAGIINSWIPGYIDVNISLPPISPLGVGVQIGDGPAVPWAALPTVHPYLGLQTTPGYSFNWAPWQTISPGLNIGVGGYLPPPYPVGFQFGNSNGGYFWEIGVGTPGAGVGGWYVW